jgi:hypothetical protein
VFVEEEYVAFPVATHDDMLDRLARIADPEVTAICGRGLPPSNLPLAGHEAPEHEKHNHADHREAWSTAH